MPTQSKPVIQKLTRSDWLLLVMIILSACIMAGGATVMITDGLQKRAETSAFWEHHTEKEQHAIMTLCDNIAEWKRIMARDHPNADRTTPEADKMCADYGWRP